MEPAGKDVLVGGGGDAFDVDEAAVAVLMALSGAANSRGGEAENAGVERFDAASSNDSALSCSADNEADEKLDIVSLNWEEYEEHIKQPPARPVRS